MSITRNTSYNLLGSMLPLAISLITVPIYLQVIGLERFGILSICWLLLGYFGVFDLGLGRALAQRIAVLKEDAPSQRALVFWTGFWVSAGLAVVGTIVIVPAAQYMLTLMKFESAEVAAEVSEAVVWLAASLPIALLTGIFTGALSGRERFGLINVAEILSSVLTAVGPLAIAWWFGPELRLLVATALAARLLSAALLFYWCLRFVPAGSPSGPDLAVAKSLATYGGWVSVSSIVGPLLAFWDRFAIGWMIGAAAVSIYVIPFTLVYRLAVIPGALAKALFPRFATTSDDQTRVLQDRGLLALSFLTTPAILAVFLLVRPFLDLWVGSELGEPSARVAFILLPGVWINGFAQISYSLLQAQDRPNIVAKIHLAELLPYGAVLFLGLALFGLEGAALAWTLRVTFDAILLFRFSKIGAQPLLRLGTTGVLVYGAAAVAVTLPDHSLGRWLSLGAMVVTGTLLSYNNRPAAFDSLLKRLRSRARFQP